MSKMQMDINEVDYSSKKNIEELNDKMEIERCVNELVSWVSE